MIGHTAKILRYELENLVRSRWVLMIGLFFFIATEALFRFGTEPTKVLVSLMNIILIILPLMSLALGIIYFYQSREFVELLLAQPIKRSAIFLGKVTGLSLSLGIVFAAGMGIPFILHAPDMGSYAANMLTVLGVGCLFIAIFVSLAFMIAVAHEDKIRGFGTAILVWLYLSVIYDAVILVAIYLFRDYPLEKPLAVVAALNPIDLGRILILLHLDIAALMGFTGAVFQRFFGGMGGALFASGVLALWLAGPLLVGLQRFRRRDF